jgi:spore coat protein U-like protein
MRGAKSVKWLTGSVVGTAAMLGLAAPAFAVPDTETADAQVAVVRPLEFISVENLNFGSIIRSTTAGTVIVAPNGTRTKTGTIILQGNAHQPARFAGMGTNNQQVDISLGANQIFITGPGAPMRVHTFVIGSTPTAVLTSVPRRFGIASSTGIFSFPVGATLDVGANQTPGTYTGTWTITLNYQ